MQKRTIISFFKFMRNEDSVKSAAIIEIYGLIERLSAGGWGKLMNACCYRIFNRIYCPKHRASSHAMIRSTFPFYLAIVQDRARYPGCASCMGDTPSAKLGSMFAVAAICGRYWPTHASARWSSLRDCGLWNGLRLSNCTPWDWDSYTTFPSLRAGLITSA